MTVATENALRIARTIAADRQRVRQHQAEGARGQREDDHDGAQQAHAAVADELGELFAGDGAHEPLLLLCCQG